MVPCGQNGVSELVTEDQRDRTAEEMAGALRQAKKFELAEAMAVRCLVQKLLQRCCKLLSQHTKRC